MRINNWKKFNEGYDHEDYANRVRGIIKSIRDGDIEDIRSLISDGVDINVNGGIMLRQAIKHGHLDIVKLLVEAGADWGKDMNEGKALMVSLENDNPEIAEWLFENGWNKNITTVAIWMGLCKARLTPEKRLHYLDVCQSWIDSGKGEYQTDGYDVRSEDGSFSKKSYDEIIREYGDFKSFVISQHQDLQLT